MVKNNKYLGEVTNGKPYEKTYLRYIYNGRDERDYPHWGALEAYNPNDNYRIEVRLPDETYVIYED
ncbi:hypothetical protein COK29_31425, partial [Bacillus cereus]|uniref:hypothetical protein n=1 Tax=Bacillus cereus TaxID=1396 RepID=UPI000C00CBF3